MKNIIAFILVLVATYIIVAPSYEVCEEYNKPTTAVYSTIRCVETGRVAILDNCGAIMYIYQGTIGRDTIENQIHLCLV